MEYCQLLILVNLASTKKVINLHPDAYYISRRKGDLIGSQREDII